MNALYAVVFLAVFFIAIIFFFSQDVRNICFSCIFRSLPKRKPRPSLSRFFAKMRKSVVTKSKTLVAGQKEKAVTASATIGGWLFLIFSVWVLLPPVWQWLLAHPAFLWMPPLLSAAAWILFRSKSAVAQCWGALIVVVLLVALITALTENRRKAVATIAQPPVPAQEKMPALTPPHGKKASPRAQVRTRAKKPVPAPVVSARAMESFPTPLLWNNCVSMPPQDGMREYKDTLVAPIGEKWSGCYSVRGLYWLELDPEACVKVRWINGMEWIDCPDVAIKGGDNVPPTLAVFKLQSHGSEAVNVPVKLVKK